MNIKITKRLIAIVCLLMLLIAAVVVVALRERRPAPLPEAPVAQAPAELRVKAVERKSEPLDSRNVEAVKLLKPAPRHTLMEFGILSPETA